MKKFSKGMLQRAGLAQSLMGDPDLLVYDEPMSGLDPVGRKEVRDLIHDLRDAGKTVFFSSHILADVEMVCDRVAIIQKGKVHDLGTISELVRGTVRSTEVILHLDHDTDEATKKELAKDCLSSRSRSGDLFVELGPGSDINAFLERAIGKSARIVSVTPRHETLEDVFIRSASEESGS